MTNDLRSQLGGYLNDNLMPVRGTKWVMTMFTHLPASYNTFCCPFQPPPIRKSGVILVKLTLSAQEGFQLNMKLVGFASRLSIVNNTCCELSLLTLRPIDVGQIYEQADFCSDYPRFKYSNGFPWSFKARC
jgi:hypothetical protein